MRSGKEKKKRIKPFVCDGADIYFENTYVLCWADRIIEVLSTPGHSPGSVCIKVGRMLFTGDSLLEQGSMNRFPGGSEKTYQETTIPILRKMIGEIDYIYPGHGDIFSPLFENIHI